MNQKQEVLQCLFKHRVQPTPKVLNEIMESPNPLQTAELLVSTAQPGIITSLKKEESEVPAAIQPYRTQVRVLKNYRKNTPVTNVQDMASFFNSRYQFFKKLLKGRLDSPVSIAHASKVVREKVSLIAIVSSKSTTKKGNIMIELEDPSGVLKSIATRQEVKDQALGVVTDEVIGVRGSMGEGILFIDEIVWPDVPVTNKHKALNTEIYAAFLSDIHIGSNKFMRDEFMNFLSWINGDSENEDHRALAENMRYLFVAGDVVDGVGVYPGQDSELEYTDVLEQYQEAANLFSKIPNHIQIILCPGNHDYVRLAQPQPPLYGEAAAPFEELPNLTLVSNPSLVNIHGFENQGISVLLYHGVSIDSMVPSSPLYKEGYSKPQVVMQALLQRRHLSPQYESGVVAGGTDFMIIDEVPDILHTGHVHSNGIQNYRGVTLINSGTWQAKTEFQVLLGHEPTPCQLPIVNLKTRAMTTINFNQKQ